MLTSMCATLRNPKENQSKNINTSNNSNEWKNNSSSNNDEDGMTQDDNIELENTTRKRKTDFTNKVQEKKKKVVP